MSNTSLLGPSGSPVAELGGERAWRQRVLHGIVCSYQWLDLRPYGCDEEQGPEPCMVLFAETRRMDTGAKVIRARDAYLYARNDGEPTEALAQSAADAAMTLGFDPRDRSVVTKIIDIIVEGIPDLLLMPTDQPAVLAVRKRIQGIETTVRMGETVMHQEIQ